MADDRPEETMHRLVMALLDGDQAEAVGAALALRAAGIDNARIIADGIEAAMGHLNAKCRLQQFNLLKIMLCGRAVTAVMKALFPVEAPFAPTQGTVVLAALEGDVHDLGKNIVRMILTVEGYRVVDCGKDCLLDHVIETVGREGEGQHYPLDQAGVWVDCVRQGRPIIHNDYASLPHRQGLPPGHATIVRQLTVPVLRDGRPAPPPGRARPTCMLADYVNGTWTRLGAVCCSPMQI